MWMSPEGLCVAGMGIAAGHDVHPEFAAPGGKFTEGTAIAQIIAAIVQGHLRRIKSHRATGTKAFCAGVNFLKVAEPHYKIVIARVVLGESYLGPTHGLVEPSGGFSPACLSQHLGQCRYGRSGHHQVSLSDHLVSIEPIFFPATGDLASALSRHGFFRRSSIHQASQ